MSQVHLEEMVFVTDRVRLWHRNDFYDRRMASPYNVEEIMIPNEAAWQVKRWLWPFARDTTVLSNHQGDTCMYVEVGLCLPTDDCRARNVIEVHGSGPYYSNSDGGTLESFEGQYGHSLR